MKNKFLSLIIAFAFIITCGFAFTGCRNKSYYEPPRNIVSNIPEKVHVEYGGIVYVKDGNDIYAKSGVYSMSGRGEVYVRENLEDGVFYWQGSGQHYISARWTGSAWENADNDTYYPDNGWVANDQNHSVIGGNVDNNQGPATSKYIYHGYSDVNTSLTDHATITQLENETLTLASGQQIECVVWQYEWEYNNSYSKSKYYFAKTSGIYLKGLSVYDKTTDIDTDGSTYSHAVATYYAEGENMNDFLQTLDPARTIPDFSPWH